MLRALSLRMISVLHIHRRATQSVRSQYKALLSKVSLLSLVWDRLGLEGPTRYGVRSPLGISSQGGTAVD